MASMIEIGKHTQDGSAFEIDLPRLTETRLLVQAGSGGGKSWLIRKLCEETHGKVQQILLDVEGDFASLREKYDYVYAGKGGDIPAEVKSAELMARKVLELEASIIIDLYELKHHERIRFVKLFLDAMVNAPKELWHRCLVIIDEAHIFAPEKGESEAMGSVIDLATRGRKRGFCAVLATQRLSKLHKDAAAECLNKLIGMTGLDIDRKRASEELGFTKKEQALSLRDLEPGEFFAFGPAISKTIQKVQVGAVKTTHPKAGQRQGAKASVPVATEKVKSILAKLADLPQEAERELNDKASLHAEVSKLRRELTIAKGAQATAAISEVDKERLMKWGYEKGRLEGRAELELKDKVINGMALALQKIAEQAATAAKEGKNVFPIEVTTARSSNILTNIPLSNPILPKTQSQPSALHYKPLGQLHEHANNRENEAPSFGKAERLILKFLAMRDGRTFSKAQIGAMTGYAPQGGSFNNALSRLRTSGLIQQTNGDHFHTYPDKLQEIAKILGADFATAETNALEQWLEKLGKAPKMIYKVLLDQPMGVFSKQELGAFTGYEASGGSFNNAISQLCTLGLAVREGDNVRLNPELLQV